MKHTVILLAAGLASAAKIHFPQHGHAHAKRQYGGAAFTTWTTVTTTDATMTCTAGSCPTGNSNPGPVNPGPVNPVGGPVGGPVVQKEAVAPQQVTTPAAPTANPPAAPVGDVNAQQIAANQAQVAKNNAAQQSNFDWQQGQIDKQNGYASGGAQPAPAQTGGQQPPVVYPSSTTSTSSAGAPANTNTSPNPNPAQGGAWPAYGTHYTPAGSTSCGTSPGYSDHIVAISETIMTASKVPGPNGPTPYFCGAPITITYNGVPYDATVVESCGACSSEPTGHIDVAEGWLYELNQQDAYQAGHLNFQWQFKDPAMAAKYQSYM